MLAVTWLTVIPGVTVGFALGWLSGWAAGRLFRDYIVWDDPQPTEGVAHRPPRPRPRYDSGVWERRHRGHYRGRHRTP